VTALLDPRAADRLAKFCSMFGSDHDGERAAAAAKADRLIRQHGLTWRQILLPSKVVVDLDHVQTDEGEAISVEELVDFCLVHGADIITNWEWGFLNGIRYWPNSLTAKQRNTLDRLVAKVQAATCAA
jgi:hypothetical protein